MFYHLNHLSGVSYYADTEKRGAAEVYCRCNGHYFTCMNLIITQNFKNLKYTHMQSGTYCHVQQLQIGAFSSQFTKNMSMFSERCVHAQRWLLVFLQYKFLVILQHKVEYQNSERWKLFLDLSANNELRSGKALGGKLISLLVVWQI